MLMRSSLAGGGKSRLSDLFAEGRAAAASNYSYNLQPGRASWAKLVSNRYNIAQHSTLNIATYSKDQLDMVSKAPCFKNIPLHLVISSAESQEELVLD